MSTYLIDTNLIMSDPYITNKIKGECNICSVVLSELDNHKTRGDEVGKNIREFARNLAAYKYGNVTLIQNKDTSDTKNDLKIINLALKLDCTLLTNDNLMFAIAESLNCDVELFNVKKTENADEMYPGMYKTDLFVDDYVKNKTIHPNSYILAADGLFRVEKSCKITRINDKKSIWGINALNLEQSCILNALMNPDISLVTITGKAGSGKTLCSVAAMLEQTLNSQVYEKMLIARPVVPMGKDIGFLPGDVNEKLGPWLQPIFDNLEILMGSKKTKDWEQLIEAGVLEVGALTYIRGRSIPNQIVLIDESQNLSIHEIITILTRAGKGTKIILTGDVEQIDSSNLDSINNGLSYVIDKFKDQSISAHITLKKCERSELADIACKIL